MSKREYHEIMGNYFDLTFYYVSGKIVSPLQLSVKNSGDELMQLSEAEKNIIGILDCKGDQKIGDLAVFSNLSYKNMSKFVDRIEREGYVERYIDPTCRRNVYVRITEKGKVMHAKYLNSVYIKAEEFFNKYYTDDEQTELKKRFEALLEMLYRLDKEKEEK